VETTGTDVELRWRPSQLTLAIAAGAAAAIAVAVIAGRWQLIAFVAPLLGVLCSVPWQPPPPKIRVHVQPASQRCFETEQAQVSVWVTTEPVGAPVGLTVSAHPTMELEALEPDSQATGLHRVVAVSAARWGRYPVRAEVAVAARGGLLAGSATVDAADVAVFPLTPPQSTPIPPTELLARLGTHLTRHMGRGVEYADIRAYVPGDPMRMVNWPVSARRGSLHVTQRLTDRAADVIVLIDTYAHPRGPASQAAERAAYGAAQVVQTALRNGDRAGIVTLGGRRPRWLGADIGQRQFYRVLDAVLGAGDAFETTTGTLAPRAALPAGAVVIAFSTLLESEFGLALTDLRRRGHFVLAVDVLPGSPFEGEVDPLVTRMWTLQRSAMYRDMSTVGIDVVSWPEDRPLEQSMLLVTDRRRPAQGVRR
jgi:uncharacterized protein (DUF58 family)